MAGDFLKTHIDTIETLGFWDEMSKKQIIHRIEAGFKDEILMEWHISDLVPNGEKFIFKWRRNLFKLSLEEVQEKYR
jgi:hypothetical protein